MTVYTIPAYLKSFLKVIIDGQELYFSFDYNEIGDYWVFGLWTDEETNLFQTKLVPYIPLNSLFVIKGVPNGYFYCLCKSTDKIDKNAVLSGAATLAYLPKIEIGE